MRSERYGPMNRSMAPWSSKNTVTWSISPHVEAQDREAAALVDPSVRLRMNGRQAHHVLLADQPIVPLERLERPFGPLDELRQMPDHRVAAGEEPGQCVIPLGAVGHVLRQEADGLTKSPRLMWVRYC